MSDAKPAPESPPTDSDSPAVELARIVESARRLGVELDEAETVQWLAAMAAARGGDEAEVVLELESGAYGHRISMLDFSPLDLARFREIGRLVALPERPGVIETALALSGSAAQSKIQTFPGDCDYFQRVNIRAGSRDEAVRLLADAMREKALGTLRGPGHQLLEVKFGSYPFDVVRDGQPHRRGTSISWSPGEVAPGRLEVHGADGAPATVDWYEVAADPGWCKLDWVVADPVRGQLANACNVIDATWEAPDGSITPLDGYLDGYFQEVYLSADSIPIFAKLARHVSADSLDSYVEQLEREVRRYLTDEPNYGKAAKRMYNIFRLTGRYLDAAFLRELFDEPTTILYQVWSLIRTLDQASEPGSALPLATVASQADALILGATGVLEGEAETEILRSLLRLRDAVTRQASVGAADADVAAARGQVINLVNTFFRERLSAVPSIRDYIEQLQRVPEPVG